MMLIRTLIGSYSDPTACPKIQHHHSQEICKPLEEVITAEVEAYTSYCLQNIDAIEHDLEQNKEGFNVTT